MTLENSFSKLVQIMQTLRSKEGCPWDQKQSHASLIRYLREECFEVIEGILKEDDALLKEELGDLLFQVIFHAEMAKERGAFDIHDVIKKINQKMEYRHPHVFDPNHVMKGSLGDQWDALKLSEKSFPEKNGNHFEEIPASMEPPYSRRENSVTRPQRRLLIGPLRNKWLKK